MSAFTTAIIRISKTNTKSLTVGKKTARNLIYPVSSWIFFESKTDVSFDFEADVVVALGLKAEIKLLAAKFRPRCPPCCLLWFSREQNAWVHLIFPLNEMYGYSRLCDRFWSSAIKWKQLSLRSSAIFCDHMETSLWSLETTWLSLSLIRVYAGLVYRTAIWVKLNTLWQHGTNACIERQHFSNKDVPLKRMLETF